MYIKFLDMHEDDGDEGTKIVEATDEEWLKLVAPCREENLPINAANVDEELFNHLYERPAVPKAKGLCVRVVPIV